MPVHNKKLVAATALFPLIFAFPVGPVLGQDQQDRRSIPPLTGPLAEDGLVDYYAALNRELSRGVTPENNAAVLLWQAFGPRSEGAEQPPRFFEMLGVDRPPDEGDYFVSFDEFVERSRSSRRVSDRAPRARPVSIMRPLARRGAGPRRSDRFSLFLTPFVTPENIVQRILENSTSRGRDASVNNLISNHYKTQNVL